MNDGMELRDLSASPLQKTRSYEEINPDFPRLTEVEDKTVSAAKRVMPTSSRPSGDELDIEFDATPLSDPLSPVVKKADEQVVKIVVSEDLPPLDPPVAQLRVAVQEVPLDPQAIKSIQDLVNNNPDDLSTQKLLSAALTEIATLGCKAEIVSTLKGSPKPELETFSVPSAPGEAYYKLGVTYQIKVTKDGQDVKGFDIPVIEREIYTTSKTPEGAIFAANDFKRTVVELANKHSDPAYKGIEFDDKKKDEVMNQRSFKFNYVYNAEGKPTALQSIHADNKEKTELKAKADPEAKNFVYYRDLKTKELHKIKKDDETATFTGRAIYGSEEEALLNTPYVIKDDSPYERIASGKTFDQQIGAIKEEIKKREAEMDEIKSTFIKQPRLKLFSSPHETVEFKQLQANLAYEKAEKGGNKLPPENELSPAKQKEIQLGKLEKKKKGIENEHKNLLLIQKFLGEKMDADPGYEMPADDKHNKAKTFMEKMIHQYKDDPGVKGQPLMAQLSACIKLKEKELEPFSLLENEISAAKDAVNIEKRKMNGAIVKFQNANLALQSNLELLIKIKQGASDKAKEPTATQESLQIAEHIGKSISDKEINELRATIEANKEFLAKIEPKVTY